MFINYQFSNALLLVRGKDLSFCFGPQTSFTNKNASEEEKMLGNAPQ